MRWMWKEQGLESKGRLTASREEFFSEQGEKLCLSDGVLSQVLKKRKPRHSLGRRSVFGGYVSVFFSAGVILALCFLASASFSSFEKEIKGSELRSGQVPGYILSTQRCSLRSPTCQRWNNSVLLGCQARCLRTLQAIPNAWDVRSK